MDLELRRIDLPATPRSRDVEPPIRKGIVGSALVIPGWGTFLLVLPGCVVRTDDGFPRKIARLLLDRTLDEQGRTAGFGSQRSAPRDPNPIFAFTTRRRGADMAVSNPWL